MIIYIQYSIGVCLDVPLWSCLVQSCIFESSLSQKSSTEKQIINKLVLIQHFLLYLRTQSTLYILPHLHPLIQAPSAMLLSAFYLLFIDFDTRMDALEITWGLDML